MQDITQLYCFPVSIYLIYHYYRFLPLAWFQLDKSFLPFQSSHNTCASKTYNHAMVLVTFTYIQLYQPSSKPVEATYTCFIQNSYHQCFPYH